MRPVCLRPQSKSPPALNRPGARSTRRGQRRLVMLSNWFVRWLHGTSVAKRRASRAIQSRAWLKAWPPSNRTRRCFRPTLDVLESRLAPAVFTVNTVSDTLAANFTTGQDVSGKVSLHSAVQAANALGGSNTINMPAGTYDLSGQLNIKNNLTISGAGASSTSIDGQSLHR